MSARQQNNVQFTAIGKAVGLSTSDINSLNDGEVALMSLGGVRLNDANSTVGMRFKVVVGGPNGKPSFISDVIDGTKSRDVASKAHIAATEQVDYIGYNGAAGSIDEISDNLFMATVHIQEYLTSNTDGRYIKHFQYKSGASATQAKIAKGLLTSAINNFSREAENYMGFELMTDEAGAAITGTATAFVVKENSNVIVLDGTVTNVVAGDFLRLGGTGTDTSVYEVASIDSPNTISLVHKYQTTGASIAVASVEVVTAAEFNASEAGLKLFGKPLSFKVGKEFYAKARWVVKTGLGDSGASMGETTITESVSATEGTGTYEQAKELEWFTKGNEGEYFRMGEPAIFDYESSVTSTAGYDLTDIRFVNDDVVGFQANVSNKALTIVSPEAVPAYMSGTDDTVWRLLEKIIGLTGGSLTV